MAKFLITGANGLLAQAIKNHSFFTDHVAFNKQEMNILDVDQCRQLIIEHSPKYLINCAAYTDVTKAETDFDRAYQINAIGAKNLAMLSTALNFQLIHISTDFVFPGNDQTERKETDLCFPVNAYGLSKREGEKFVMQYAPSSLILRISWLFGPHGRNFVSTISQLMKERESLNIVSDQWGRVTYSPDCAEAISALISCNAQGIVHFANAGINSRYEFSMEILRLMNTHETVSCNIKAILAKDYPDPTPRPSFSVLNTDLFESLTHIKIRSWKEALKAYIDEQY